MTTSLLFLVLSTFLACAVEAVEALTVVLAVGVTRGCRSALLATAAATLCLAAMVAVFGPALARVPLETLRLVVGTLLLIFGLRWLRRSAGDECAYDGNGDLLPDERGRYTYNYGFALSLHPDLGILRAPAA